MKRYDAGILGVVIIWAAVIIASALILEGTQYFSQLLPILAGGASGSLIILGGTRPKDE